MVDKVFALGERLHLFASQTMNDKKLGLFVLNSLNLSLPFKDQSVVVLGLDAWAACLSISPELERGANAPFTPVNHSKKSTLMSQFF